MNCWRCWSWCWLHTGTTANVNQWRIKLILFALSQRETIELYRKSTEMLRFYGFLIWAKKCARYGGFFIPYFWEKSILHTRAHTSYVLILTHIQLQPVGINGYRWYKKNSYRQKGIVKNNVPEKTAPTHTHNTETHQLFRNVHFTLIVFLCH